MYIDFECWLFAIESAGHFYASLDQTLTSSLSPEWSQKSRDGKKSFDKFAIQKRWDLNEHIPT